MKKTVLWMLVFCLMLAGLPLSAQAEPPAGSSAAAVLTAGGAITLEEDLVLTEDVSITRDTVLDLNGHSIAGSLLADEAARPGDGFFMGNARSWSWLTGRKLS